MRCFAAICLLVASTRCSGFVWHAPPPHRSPSRIAISADGDEPAARASNDGPQVPPPPRRSYTLPERADRSGAAPAGPPRQPSRSDPAQLWVNGRRRAKADLIVALNGAQRSDGRLVRDTLNVLLQATRPDPEQRRARVRLSDKEYVWRGGGGGAATPAGYYYSPRPRPRPLLLLLLHASTYC